MSSFWTPSSSADANRGGPPSKLLLARLQGRRDNSTHFAMEFPLDPSRVVNLVRARHELLVHPAGYFTAIARRMHAVLPEPTWLGNLRLLHAGAQSESECLLTWIYAKHYARLASEPIDPTLGGREALLSEISAGYLARPAITAAETAVQEVGHASRQRLLLPCKEAMLLTDALRCSGASNTPRWLAFSAAELDNTNGLWVLDGMLKLRTLLDDAGEHRSSSEVGRTSEDLVRRIAATWLIERAPLALRAARDGRTALFDSIMLHDARIRAEEYAPQRNERVLPEWLDLRQAHERLERQIGGVIDLALEMSAPKGAKREAGSGARVRMRRIRTETATVSLPEANQTALIEFLSSLLRGTPRHELLAEALLPEALLPEALLPNALPLEAGMTSNQRPGASTATKGARSSRERPSLFRLRAIGLIGAALRIRELDSRPSRKARTRAAKSAPPELKPVSQPRPSNPLGPGFELAPSRAILPLDDLLAVVKWLGCDPSTSAGAPRRHDAQDEAWSASAAGPISRIGGFAFVPHRVQAPTIADPGSAPRAFKAAEISVARGTRYLSGELFPIIDAGIAVVQLGARRAVDCVAGLSSAEFETFLKHAPLSSSVIDRIRLGLLRDHGAKAVELMPQFAQPELEPNAWLALWLRLNPGHPLPHRSEEARLLNQLAPAELDQLPESARRAYLMAYISRFGEDASHHIPSTEEAANTTTPSRAEGRAVTSLGAFLGTIALAARALPYSVVRKHVPLRALAAALPQEEFDQLEASDLEVGELFGYGGPKARVVWTHAWRRLARSSPAETTGCSDGTDDRSATPHPARAAVLRAIERGRFTLRSLCTRAPESSGGDSGAERGGERRGDIARILLSDSEIAQRLLLQVRDAHDVAFLARAGGKQVIRSFDDAMIAQLVITACGEDDGARLTQLLLESANRAKAAAAAGKPPDPGELRGTIDGRKEYLRCRSSCTALTAVQREMRTVAERVSASGGELMAATPRADSERRAVRGQRPEGPPLPIPQPTRRRADVARALLRIIGLSSGRCEVPLETVQKLTRIVGGRDSADLMRAAIIGRRHQRRGTAEHQKRINEAIAVALELAHHGLADEFPQLVDAALAQSLDSRYITHRIQKKRGGIREINEPDADLKRLQRKILARMLAGIPLSRNAHGFIRGRGIRTNATAHTRQRVVLNVDIRNFFGSLPIERVRSAIAQSRRGALSPAAVDLLVKVVTRAGSLPQGAPTSPMITNIALRHIDGILDKSSTRVGIRYTRYADDLTFSGADGPVQRILPLVRDTLRAVGLELHPDKTHVYRSGRRQLVTGLVVNDRPNLPRRDRRKLRAAAHAMAQGQPMHWNGQPMPPTSFAGRLAYLATVSATEAEGLWKSAGLEKFFREESRRQRKAHSAASHEHATRAAWQQTADIAKRLGASPPDNPHMQQTQTNTGNAP